MRTKLLYIYLSIVWTVIWLCSPTVGLAVPELYFGSQGSISKANPDSFDLQGTLISECFNPVGIEFHLLSRKVYWVDVCYGAIRRANSDGSELEDVFVLEEGVEPLDLALTEASEWIYWIEQRPTAKRIRRVRFDGSGAEDIISQGLSLAGGIALHEEIGKIYWVQVEPPVQNSVYRANLDGTDVEKIADLPEVASFPAGIAIDKMRSLVYWTQGSKILQANLDGSGATEAAHPFAGIWDDLLVTSLVVDQRDGTIYFTAQLDTRVSSLLARREFSSGEVRHIQTNGQSLLNGITFDSETESLFYTDLSENAISRFEVPLDSERSFDTFPTGPLFGLSDIEFHPGESALYWADGKNNSIGYTNIDNGESTILLDRFTMGTLIELDDDEREREFFSVGSIALDLSRGKLYWDLSPHAILRANLDGTNVEQIVSDVSPSSIAIDEVEAKIYWAYWGSATIERANLDGSERETIVENATQPRGLFLDRAARKIYWANGKTDTVWRSNFDGSALEIVFSLPEDSHLRTVAPDLANGKLYLLWDFGRKVGRADLDGSDLELTIGTRRVPAADLVVIQRDAPPEPPKPDKPPKPPVPAPPRVISPVEGTFFSVQTFEVRGHAEPGATVEIVLGETSLGSVSVRTDTSWVFPEIEFPSEGTYTVSAIVRKEDVLSQPTRITVIFDKTEPAPPVIVTSSIERNEDELIVTISGKGEPGAVVEIFEGEYLMGDTLIDSFGNWSLMLTPSVLTQQFLFRARARDRAENISAFSETTIVVNKPERPVINTITAHWNGFLEMINVLELSNSDSRELQLTVELLDDAGIAQGRTTVVLRSQEQRDIVVNELTGFRENAFGLLRISSESGLPKGRVAFYRNSVMSSADGVDDRFDFAFTVPFSDPLKGQSAVAFNTFNPNQTVKEEPVAVSNWLSVINLNEQSTKSFSIARYTIGEKEPVVTQIVVPPLGRRDIDGGHGDGPHRVGLNIVTPEDETTEYRAFLSRYGPGEMLTNDREFRFAVTLAARTPAKVGEWVPVSRGAGGQNWVELVNTSQEERQMLVKIYENGKASPVFEEEVAMSPFGQYHLNANAYLSKGASGAAHLEPRDEGRFIAQSMFYFKGPSKRLEAVYVTPSRSGHAESQNGSWNLFLEMFNFVRIFNTSDEAQKVQLTVQNGATQKEHSIILQPKSGHDLGLHEQSAFGTSTNTYGSFTVSGNNLLVDLLRYRPYSPVGGIDFMFSTKVH